MNTFTLETGVPLTYYDRSARETEVLSSREVVTEDRLPFKDMEVGESFYAAMPDNHLWFLARTAGPLLGRFFVVRVAEGGARAWRVAEAVETKRGRKMMYPWKTLEVGEAFVMKNRDEMSVRPIVAKAGQMYNRSFSVKRVVNRDWRVERVA